MAFFDDIKMILRVGSKAYDAEIAMLIDAAKADMVRVGVRPELVDASNDADIAPLVKKAIAMFCKANFGFDNQDASLYYKWYRQTVTDLMNSQANIAAQEDDSE